MNIVFVHLNSKIPKFLKSNLETCLKYFPNSRIYLIHNLVDDSFQVDGIEMYKYVPREDWKDLEKNLSHPKMFRSNFWLTSLARFIAIADFMQDLPGPVIHIESDNILASDFPIEKFLKLESEYAFPIVSKKRGIASLVYFKAAQSSRDLADFSLEQAKINPSTSDMLVLRNFYDLNKDRVQVLPTGLSMQTSFNNPIDNDVLKSMNRGMGLLGGIFDGSDLGVFFLGTDPRNRRGLSIVGSPVPENYADTQNWKLTPNTNRKFVDLSVDNSTAKVFSLHATCKRMKLFRSESQFERLKKLLKKSGSGQRTIYYIDVFLLALLNSSVKRYKLTISRICKAMNGDKNV
jgi:hypothetical protein